jgi:hypothetical protein
MRVKWEELDPGTYERMTSVLLSRLHPGRRRIDGSGGDGGRDVHFPGPKGLEIHELKSFTGRLTKGRKGQIKRSLRRAAEYNPAQWTLVVPIDPTPRELTWFEELKAAVSFPLDWQGRTWLDGQMAAHPDIPRYFLAGAADEVVQLLKDLREERAQVRSAGDAVERLRSLHGRLNEIDPYYRYELTIGHEAAASGAQNAILSVSYGDARVDLYPRYVGADLDRPITIGLQLAFGPGDTALQEAFKSMMDFGTPVSLEAPVIQRVEIDAPSGLGNSFAGGFLQLASPQRKAEPIKFTAEVFEGERLVAALPFAVRPDSGGRKGVVLTGTDASGWLDAKITVDLGARNYKVSLGLRPTPVLPATVLPLLRFLASAQTPNFMRLVSPVLGSAAPIPLTNEPLIENATLKVVEALSEVQRVSGVHFDLPTDLTQEEAVVILKAQRLLSGNEVRARWSPPMRIEMTLAPDTEGMLQRLSSEQGAALLIEADQEVRIREHRIPLGRIRTVIPSARLADTGRVPERTAEGGITLDLIPGAEAELIFQPVVSRRPDPLG